MNPKVGAWAGVLGLGLILFFAGIEDRGGDSQVGLIVFAGLTTSVGVSGLLGIAHDPSSTGITFGLIGFFIPGWSLPFLVYYALKGASERDEYARVAAQEQAEREAGLRCAHCGRMIRDGHDPRCVDFVHEVGMVLHHSGEWLLADGSHVPPATTYSVRCSCGHETARYENRETAVGIFKSRHGDLPGIQIVPDVNA